MERQKRTEYSSEFKIKAVELSNQRGSLMAVAQELNISRDNLKRWKNEFSKGLIKITGTVSSKSKEELEITRLKKELYEAKMERDILKKAVGIFTKND